MKWHTKCVALLTALSLVACGGPVPDAAELDAPEQATPGQRIRVNRQMLAGDPNRDASWDWTLNQTYTMYVNGVGAVTTLLPYYSNQGPAAADLNVAGDRDIDAAKGWRLVLRDFGSPSLGVSLPFFVLYNKYRGILRVFYWSVLPQTFTYATAKLSFQTTGDPTRTAALFTMPDPTRAFVDNYNPEYAQIAIGRALYHQWCYFDFDVTGYDPNLINKPDPSFFIQITGTDKSDLVLEGKIDLTQGTTTANQPQSSNGFKSATTAFNEALKTYKQIEGFQSDVKKKVWKDGDESKGPNTDNQNKWWYEPLKGLVPVVAAKFIPYLGPVVSLFKFLKGGGPAARQPAPMVFHGDVKLQGTLTTSAPLYDLLFRVPGALHVDPVNDALSNTLPLYDRPLGLFNLLTAPRLGWYTYTHMESDPYDGREWEVADGTEYWLTRPLQYVVNPDADMRVVTLQAAFHREGATTDGYVKDGDDGFRAPCELMGALGWDPYQYYQGRNVAVKLQLVPNTPVAGFEPVTLLKSYPAVEDDQVDADGARATCSSVHVGSWSGTTAVDDLLVRAPGNALSLRPLTSGNYSAPGTAAGSIDFSAYENVWPDDWTGDGRTDFMVRAPNGDMYLFAFNGTGFSAGTKVGTIPYAYSLIPGRWNNTDSTPDVMARTWDGKMLVYDFLNGAFNAARQVGTGFTYPTLWGFFPGRWSNADAVDDLISYSTNGTLKFHAFNGTSFSAGVTVMTGFPVPFSHVLVGNFTGDGTADLLVRTTSGTLKLHPFNNNVFTVAGGLTLASADPYTSYFTGDWNGDGVTDVLARKSGESTLMMRPLSNSAFGTAATLNGVLDP